MATHLHVQAGDVHLHAPSGPCSTVCGLACDSVETAYRGLDPKLETVTCDVCKEGAR